MCFPVLLGTCSNATSFDEGAANVGVCCSCALGWAGDHFVGFILLMVYSGMVPSELLTRQGDMVDFEKPEIIGCSLKAKKYPE